MSTGTLFGIALLLDLSAMILVWVLAFRMRNNSIVDIAWSALFSVLVLVYALFGKGYLMRRAIMAGMVVFWSLRLAFHLYRRISRLHPIEEGRYLKLRAEWALKLKSNFFWFFQAQGLLNTFLSLPFLLACQNLDPKISIIEFVGVALWLIALIGEAIADRQLDQFKRRPQNKDQVCQEGLWRYSRHPNYFFEWLVWVSFFVFALSSPFGAFTIYCPLAMLYFLLKVTGIPMTEEQAIRTKGNSYREYQRTTNAFFPWFRRGSCE
jgi:steroid 5-alpha reductase family enzyme